MSPIIGLIIVLIVVGVLFWAANRILAVLPIEEPFKTIIYVLIVLLAVFFILSLFGLVPASWSGVSLGHYGGCR